MSSESRQVLVVTTKNVSPEFELAKRLEELGPDWSIISAQTSTAVENMGGGFKSIWYTATVVVERQG